MCSPPIFVAAIAGAIEPEVPLESEPTTFPATPVPVKRTEQGPFVCNQPKLSAEIIFGATPTITHVGVPGSITTAS